jgi:hypothetical protein
MHDPATTEAERIQSVLDAKCTLQQTLAKWHPTVQNLRKLKGTH